MLHQQMIKTKNKKALYDIVSNNDGISRAGLAHKTKLSKSTISLLVDELIAEDMLIDIGIVESGLQGRKPNGLRVNVERFILIANVRKRSVEIHKKLDAEYLSGIIKERLTKYGTKVLGVCVVLPAIIDNAAKNIITTVLDLEDSKNFIDKLRKNIPPEYGLAFLNDTASLTYAENIFGHIGSKNYAYININEGVGASFIYNSKILRGSTGLAMQLGHMSIEKDGALCSCGNRGCLENHIGELALKKRALNYGLIEENQNEEFLFRDLGEMSLNGNKNADALIFALADELSDALEKVIVILNPEIIVIGGMGRKLGEKYLNRIQGNIKKDGFRQFCENVKIKYTRLGDSAVFIGAAKYYMDKHFDFAKKVDGDLFLS